MVEKFQEMMDEVVMSLPKQRGDGQNRLPADLLRLRRETRRKARQGEKQAEYHALRNEYREKLREFINSGTEKQLEDSNKTGVYQLSKIGKRKKVMQYLERGGRIYRKRKEMAKCIAEH